MCPECWKAQQKILKIHITKKLGLIPLRGSRPQFAYGMYKRAELALALRKEGFSRRALVPFLNSETAAGYWIKELKELKRLFLQYLIGQGFDCTDACSVNRKIRLPIITTNYNIFINFINKCIMKLVLIQSTKKRGKYG
jgi:hypothetical protein